MCKCGCTRTYSLFTDRSSNYSPGALLGGAAGSRVVNLHALLQDFKPSTQTTNGTHILTTSATGPASYQAPAPPAETPAHPHKYIFLLYEQPASFTVPSSQKSAVQKRIGFNYTTFATDAGLKDPVRANYLQVPSGGK